MVEDKEIFDYILANPKVGRDPIKEKFHVGSGRAKRLLRLAKSGGKLEERPPDSSKENFKPRESVSISGDGHYQTIVMTSSSVKTVEEALKVTNADLTIWEVDTYKIGKWDIGAKSREQNLTWVNGTMDGFGIRKDEFIVQPMWRVEVTLKRKSPAITATESILELVKINAPLYPKIIRPKTRKVRRSLEVSIMDPHIGLRAHYPEGDGTQTLESIAETILGSIDDLVKKAEPFGPFEEIFMPFGNDFTHVDNIFHTTTAGTNQPEAEAWHRVYIHAEKIAIEMVNRLRKIAPVFIYEVPGNHSRMADFTLARLLNAQFHACGDVTVDASSNPYKFHRFGTSLIGYEHGHSVAQVRLAALMANERPMDFAETWFHEWHLGDQHRKGSSKPSMLEEQGVSIEYLPGLTVPNEWHRLKSFNHQKRGAMAFVYDFYEGQIARLQYNINTKPLERK
jgi:hypothetical protein